LRRNHLVLLHLVFAGIAHPAVAQQADTTARSTHVAGAVTITNKGISLLPALTLGKPAGILDVAIWRGGLSFEPQFRVALEGKPWSFIFWMRYRSPSDRRLRLVVGAHPALLFRTISDSIGGAPREMIVARRYLAGEVNPVYAVTRSLDLGLYYLYANGVDKDAIQNTHFIAARANLHYFNVARDYTIQLAPQLYHLTMDGKDGVYLSSALTLGKRKLPISISTLLNDPIQSSIVGGQEFIWNVSVTYSLR
jgi:hypothetical protein